MKFINRETQYPGRRQLIKVDEYNNQMVGEEPMLVNIVKDEGIVSVEGTSVDAENLNKGNWRDDDSLSFRQRSDDILPPAEAGETRMITKMNGEIWLIPPAGSGQPMKVANSVGTAIKVNGNAEAEIGFTSDPQTQITSVKNTAEIAGNTAVSAMGVANSRSVVNVNGIKADIDFTSDPQTQIDGKADQMPFNAVSQGLDNHIENTGNPHNVTKVQIGLGNADNTSDTDKPVSAAQQAAMNGKMDKVTGATTNGQFYCKEANGTQGMRDVSSNIVNGAVPIRRSDGHIAVPAIPSADTDAASKQYVDGLAITLIDTYVQNLTTGTSDVVRDASNNELGANYSKWVRINKFSDGTLEVAGGIVWSIDAGRNPTIQLVLPYGFAFVNTQYFAATTSENAGTAGSPALIPTVFNKTVNGFGCAVYGFNSGDRAQGITGYAKGRWK